MTKLKAVHPGEILMKEFIEPLGITQYKLSKDIRVPQARISKIVKGERSITPDIALREKNNKRSESTGFG